MTKADLIEQAADVTGQRVTKKDCALVVDAFLDAVKNALARGDHIEIRGLRHLQGAAAQGPQGPQPQNRQNRCRFHHALCRSSNLRCISAAGWTEVTVGVLGRPAASRSLPATTASLAAGGSAGLRPLWCVSQPTQR